MKKSLFGALLLFVLAACSPRMETVVILSTNDIHAHIEKFPQLAEAVKKCRDTVKNVILVDAGDRWTGNVYCDRAAEPRRPIIDLMNRLRYDVATFGNHEFDAGQAFLGVRTAQCRFPVVCANIVSDTATFPQPAPYAIVERGGRRIGFVASVTNYDHNNHPAGHDENFAGLTFTDAVDAVADRQSLRDTTATVRSEKDKVAEQLTDDWENWEIVRTEYVLKGRDTVPDTMRRIPAGIKRVTRVRGIRHSTSVNKKEEQEKTAQSVRLRRTESQTEIAKTVKKSSAGRIALYAIGLVALWLALRSIGKRLL